MENHAQIYGHWASEYILPQFYSLRFLFLTPNAITIPTPCLEHSSRIYTSLLKKITWQTYVGSFLFLIKTYEKSTNSPLNNTNLRFANL